jgi:hypothetical protein
MRESLYIRWPNEEIHRDQVWIRRTLKPKVPHILGDPAKFRPLGQAARQRVEAKYSLEMSIPELKGYFERVASLDGNSD